MYQIILKFAELRLDTGLRLVEAKGLFEILEVDIKDPRYDLRPIFSTQSIEQNYLLKKESIRI